MYEIERFESAAPHLHTGIASTLSVFLGVIKDAPEWQALVQSRHDGSIAAWRTLLLERITALSTHPEAKLGGTENALMGYLAALTEDGDRDTLLRAFVIANQTDQFWIRIMRDYSRFNPAHANIFSP